MENKSAFPIVRGDKIESIGLTKRELFAAMAMQGMAAKGQYHYSHQIATSAVMAADALIAELEKTKE